MEAVDPCTHVALRSEASRGLLSGHAAGGEALNGRARRAGDDPEFIARVGATALHDLDGLEDGDGVPGIAALAQEPGLGGVDPGVDECLEVGARPWVGEGDARESGAVDVAGTQDAVAEAMVQGVTQGSVAAVEGMNDRVGINRGRAAVVQATGDAALAAADASGKGDGAHDGLPGMLPRRHGERAGTVCCVTDQMDAGPRDAPHPLAGTPDECPSPASPMDGGGGFPGRAARTRRTVGAVGRALAFVVIGAFLGAVGVWGTGVPAPPGVLRVLRLAGMPVPVRASGTTVRSKADLFDETVVTAIYERAAPSIVEVAVTTANGRQGGGSGVLVAPNGTVLTNYHVVRAASTIEVTLRDRRRFVAKVLGTDPQDDIALLALTGAPTGLPLLPLGDSDALRPGAMAIAIGNPVGLDRSISVGVIAGLGRTLRDGDRPMRNVIQVDAALNPGNSGGALLDATGQVMGVTNAIERVPGRAGFGGIGFAVPSSSVRRNFARLLAGERIRHAYVGISGQDLGASVAQELGLVAGPGIAVSGVAPGGPAAQAGLRKGDAIVAVGPWRATSMEEFGAHVDRTYRPGDTVAMEVRRAGATLRLDVTLGAWPDAEDAT